MNLTTTGPNDQPQAQTQLRLLYDGGCPLCCREVTFLRRRDLKLHGDQPKLSFVDINASTFQPEDHAGITYREAMGRIHAISAEGEILRDLAVFRSAYQLVGLGWLYAPSGWPGLSQLGAMVYGLWASWRLRITGRPDLEQLCHERCCAFEYNDIQTL